MTGETGPLEERRLLSILFADLAGFTQRSDRADPEDVRGILVPFHALAKEEIERFGGTLDKFIGDAAMGVFGAPVAHEDDPERAVRAALSICERVTQRGMPVRIAVNTGEALVTFGEGPQIGERVAGDVVNTASRLQGHAPEGTVIVGETTARATRGVIAYRELSSVTVKGKADPLTVWLAEAVKPTVPERDEDDPPPFVGRDRERRALHDQLEHAIHSRTPHMVTVVGEPGIGKTRLVADLGERIRIGDDPVLFHRGRCLPYGESITFAALEEIVRALLGVPPGGGRQTVNEALARELEALEPRDVEREWLRTRLTALVGTADATEAPVARAESFAAWTRYLELVAERAPLVLVVEDLHWADPAMLEFLEHLVAETDAVPLFVVCTSRPELFAQNPSWGSGRPESTVVSLAPLPDEDMQALLRALLLHSVLPPDAREPLMRRAGGNPLYAREFVHMLEDRGDDRRGAASDAQGVSVPDTVQALIAARLDALAAGDRAVLQAAAVVGDRFWPGVLEALEPADDLDASLRELQRRGMVRRSPLSTIAEETEYAFTHALIRDVAYGRLPRAGRARMHLTVTRWLESTAGDRLSERADLLASHATRALDLARAANLTEDMDELRGSSLRFLMMAGERQTTLDVARAAAYYGKAIELAPAASADKANVMVLAASLGWRSGDLASEEAVRSYREAVAMALEADSPAVAAHGMRRLYFQLGLQGETDEATEVLNEGIALLEAQPEPAPLLAELYACRSEDAMFSGRSEESLRWANRALELASTEGVRLMALHLRGNARCELGDMAGVDDLKEALALATEAGVALDTVTSYSYLTERIGLLDGPIPALAMNEDAIELSERRGLEHQAMWSRTERLWLLFDAGRWDEVVELAAPLDAWSDEHGDAQVSTVSRTFHARVLAHRGDLHGATALIDRTLPVARQIGDLQVLAPALLVAALVAEQPALARERLQDLHDTTHDGPSEYREVLLPEAVRRCLWAGDPELAAAMFEEMAMHEPRAEKAVATCLAALAEHRGDAEQAAKGYEELGRGWADHSMPFEQGHALAGLARCLRSLERDAVAKASGAEAARIFRELGIPA